MITKKDYFTKKRIKLSARKKEVIRRPSSNHIPSLDTGIGVAVLKDVVEYTGDNMLGISQMHKSNAVPVFREEDIKDIGKMRR
jgi:hypothetical protein